MTRREIRRTLRQRAPHLPPVLTTLGFAAWQIKPDSASHNHAQRVLPSMVRADVNRIPLPPQWLPIRRHVLICASCAKTYLDLIELAAVDARGELPSPLQPAPADLSFLETPRNE